MPYVSSTPSNVRSTRIVTMSNITELARARNAAAEKELRHRKLTGRRSRGRPYLRAYRRPSPISRIGHGAVCNLTLEAPDLGAGRHRVGFRHVGGVWPQYCFGAHHMRGRCASESPSIKERNAKDGAVSTRVKKKRQVRLGKLQASLRPNKIQLSRRAT